MHKTEHKNTADHHKHSHHHHHVTNCHKSHKDSVITNHHQHRSHHHGNCQMCINLYSLFEQELYMADERQSGIPGLQAHVTYEKAKDMKV